MDPLAEKYYYVSPYVYCLNDPLNRIDPDGQTDWRLVAAGALATVSGVGTLAGVIVTEVGTAAVATPLCAFVAVEGFTAIGLGVSTMMVGFLSEPSEKTDLLLENMPTSALNTLTKSADIVAGNENHEIETTVSVLSAGIGSVSGLFKVIKGGAINPLSAVGNVADWISLMLQSNSNSNSDQDNESQNDDNDDKDDSDDK